MLQWDPNQLTEIVAHALQFCVLYGIIAKGYAAIFNGRKIKPNECISGILYLPERRIRVPKYFNRNHVLYSMMNNRKWQWNLYEMWVSDDGFHGRH